MMVEDEEAAAEPAAAPEPSTPSSSSSSSSSSGGAEGGKGYPSVTKWESGIARTGPANQISLTKWKDIVKVNRGKANTLL